MCRGRGNETSIDPLYFLNSLIKHFYPELGLCLNSRIIGIMERGKLTLCGSTKINLALVIVEITVFFNQEYIGELCITCIKNYIIHVPYKTTVLMCKSNKAPRHSMSYCTRSVVQRSVVYIILQRKKVLRYKIDEIKGHSHPYRSRHCFPIRPGKAWAIVDHFFGPYFFTISTMISSS